MGIPAAHRKCRRSLSVNVQQLQRVGTRVQLSTADTQIPGQLRCLRRNPPDLHQKILDFKQFDLAQRDFTASGKGAPQVLDKRKGVRQPGNLPPLCGVSAGQPLHVVQLALNALLVAGTAGAQVTQQLAPAG